MYSKLRALKPRKFIKFYPKTIIKYNTHEVTSSEESQNIADIIILTLVNDQLDAQFFYFIIRLL